MKLTQRSGFMAEAALRGGQKAARAEAPHGNCGMIGVLDIDVCPTLDTLVCRSGLVSNRYRSNRHQRLRPWSVAATATITCFSEMDVSDRAGALRRRVAEGGASASRIGNYHGAPHGALDASSSAMGSSRGATASTGLRGFASAVGLSWIPGWMSRAQRSVVPRPAEPAALDSCPPPVLYKQRWVQLAFLALLALLSDLVCFSVAATPGTWTKDPASLIDIFLFTNVFACFIEPFVIRNFGLRTPIVGAAMLMAVGCWLRSGIPFLSEGLPGEGASVFGRMINDMWGLKWGDPKMDG
eukprot:s2908_g12.t1